MKLAVISDIHGNLLTLHTVPADIARQGVDQTVKLGDILSGLLQLAETAELVAWPPAILAETVVPGLAQGWGSGVCTATPAEVAELLGRGTHSVVLCGHTHVPRPMQCGSMLVVNLGSFGLLAYDDDHS